MYKSKGKFYVFKFLLHYPYVRAWHNDKVCGINSRAIEFELTQPQESCALDLCLNVYN